MRFCSHAHTSQPFPRPMADNGRGDTVLTDDVIRIRIPLETPPGFVPVGLSSNNNVDDDDESVPRGSHLQLSGILRLSSTEMP